MRGKRIFACIFMLCVLGTGIVYGKWDNNIGAETDIQEEQLKYAHSGPETYALGLKSDDGIYSVDMTDMELLNDGTELNIILEKDKVNQIIKGAVYEITLSYSIMPLIGNTVTDIAISGDNILESEISTNAENKNLAIISHIIKPEKPVEIYSGNHYEFDVWIDIFKRTEINQSEDSAIKQKLNLHCRIIFQ